ncbi:MAG: cytochrome c oxidase subunit II [Novosphingobium sp.]
MKNFCEKARRAGSAVSAIGLTVGVLTASTVARAQEAVASAAPSDAAKDAAASAYVPMTPTPGIGMPVDGGLGFQKQFSPTGEYALWMHNALLLPLIIVISIFVLLLLLWVVVRYNKRANPVASKNSHNTLLEVVWTLLPVLILVGIAIPSISLLAKQYKPAPANALTVKATGNQWFWTYSYPDNGGFEVISNMLNIKGQPVVNNGVRDQGSKPWDGPAHLEVDNRMVLPAGEPIRIQTIGADVIHAFAIPALWFKLDAVPGRINEKVLFINKPGVYYGQCSELCGARHGYMPIAIEALPRDKFNAWVLAQGGKLDHQPKPAAEAAPAPAPAAAAIPSAVPATPETSASAAASAAPGA